MTKAEKNLITQGAEDAARLIRSCRSLPRWTTEDAQVVTNIYRAAADLFHASLAAQNAVDNSRRNIKTSTE